MKFSKIYLKVTLLLFPLFVFADTLTVKQDGTGDFTIIQQAVDNAVDNDIILVWPGTYYEAVACSTKNITIASLVLTTGDLSYINQTIVDANKQGSCFDIWKAQNHFELNGFTIRNGSGIDNGSYCGGGISVILSDIEIRNCIIEENVAAGNGGGIYFWLTNAFMSNVTIRNNHSHKGGGIMFAESYAEFDTVNRCNIYLNYAYTGTDIFQIAVVDTMIIVVDTFTVEIPDYYYIYSRHSQSWPQDGGAPKDDIILDCNTGKIDITYENLYVSPAGDNNNSGLSPSEPLKDIYFALLKMGSDSISPDTIFLANGIYSPSGGEKMPLATKDRVSIGGEDRDLTILDGEDQKQVIYGYIIASNYTISDLTVQNGREDSPSYITVSGIAVAANNNSTFQNILLQSNYSSGSAGAFSTCNNCLVDNVEATNNVGGRGFHSGFDTWSSDALMTYKNCRIIENYPDYTIPDRAAGGGLTIVGQTSHPNMLTAVVINCLFAGNYNQNINNGAGPGAFGISQAAEGYLINNTIVNNYSNNPDASAIGVTYGATLHAYNNIVYNNDFGPAYMSTQDWGGPTYLNIYNSLIDGGEDAIDIRTPDNYVYYDETNIDTDPLFYEGFEYPYNLNSNSPCIDAGTLDIPSWIVLPETDLAGNPRIYGETIDMGAYEWNPTVGIKENNLDKKESLLSVSPNPVSSRALISVYSNGTKNLKIEVFCNNGQRVAKITDGPVAQGTININWDINNSGIYLKSGVYIVVLSEDGVEKESVKVIISR